MSKRAELEEYCVNNSIESIFLENPSFDDAIIGITVDGNIVYEYTKMIESLMSSENFTSYEAIEFIEYNTLRAIAYMGEMKPIVINLFENLNF